MSNNPCRPENNWDSTKKQPQKRKLMQKKSGKLITLPQPSTFAGIFK
jgi:hypothetical protein